MSLNRVFLIGNVGGDPDIKHLSTGSTLVTFSLATNERFKSKKSGEWVEQTEWHNISCWDSIAEYAATRVIKGAKVMVEGRIKNKKWADKATQIAQHSVEILASNILILDSKSGDKKEREVTMADVIDNQTAFEQDKLPF